MTSHQTTLAFYACVAVSFVAGYKVAERVIPQGIHPVLIYAATPIAVVNGGSK